MKTQHQEIGFAGRRGEKAHSDCFVQVAIKSQEGIKISLKSKVDALYGDSIRKQLKETLARLGIKHAQVEIDDQGAVPFVLAARTEAAVKRAQPSIIKDAPSLKNKKLNGTKHDRLRRTRLYLPGNEPHYFLNAGLHHPDCIILDLEDSVSYSEKDAARLLVRNALAAVDFGSAERMVRINPFPMGIDDLRTIIQYHVDVVLIPKCESTSQIKEIDGEIDALAKHYGIRRQTYLLPIIESALGVERAYDIASASKWNCALSIGLEDYTADIGAERTVAGKESLFARGAVVNAAKAAGLQALDSVFSDVNDEDGLMRSSLEAKAMGYDGKGCIHPRQIPVIHKAFAPTPSEIEYAKRVFDAYREAERNGSAVVSLGSKMIDPPVVKRAERILKFSAKTSGK